MPERTAMPPKTVLITFILLLFSELAREIEGRVCHMVQEPDPAARYQYRWLVPVREPCLCTVVLFGGMSARALPRPYAVVYHDTFLHSLNLTEIQTFLGCRSDPPCSFHTEPKIPHRFAFILQPLTMPFRLDFTLKSEREPFIALATERTEASIFAEINIGGWGNTKSVIRGCHSDTCGHVLAEHNEAGIVSATESRPFWVEYDEGVVRVGKGEQEEAFLQWSAAVRYPDAVPTRVHIGIASWEVAAADWVFYQFCEN